MERTKGLFIARVEDLLLTHHRRLIKSNPFPCTTSCHRSSLVIHHNHHHHVHYPSYHQIHLASYHQVITLYPPSLTNATTESIHPLHPKPILEWPHQSSPLALKLFISLQRIVSQLSGTRLICLGQFRHPPQDSSGVDVFRRYTLCEHRV